MLNFILTKNIKVNTHINTSRNNTNYYIFCIFISMWIIILYAIAGIVNIIAEYLGIDAIKYGSKIVLMPLMMIYLYHQTKKINPLQYVYLALFFSWLGDIFLMFPRQNYTPSVAQQLFIAGLVSFLIAHIFYIISFLKEINQQKKVSTIVENPYLVLPFIIYIACFYSFLFPYLTTMKIPVLAYSITIILMLIMAFNRKNLVLNISFKMVFLGALLFVISDSLIAIDVFYQKENWHRTAIMLTYIVAQYLIVNGILVNDKIEVNQD